MGRAKRQLKRKPTNARAGLLKTIVETTEMLEKLIARITAITPPLVGIAECTRSMPHGEKLKEPLRKVIDHSCLLDIKQVDLPRQLAEDAEIAALVRRKDAALETAIRLVDLQKRLIDEALGETSAPMLQ